MDELEELTERVRIEKKDDYRMFGSNPPPLVPWGEKEFEVHDKWLEKCSEYCVYNSSHFLDKLIEYLLFENEKTYLCSLSGNKELIDEESITLKFGNTVLSFPSYKGDELVENMLLNNVIESLKILKKNYKNAQEEK